MDGGLEGAIAAETVLSHSDGEGGILWIRGHTFPELILAALPVAIAALVRAWRGQRLWHPTRSSAPPPTCCV
jgi:citrate synthase